MLGCASSGRALSSQGRRGPGARVRPGVCVCVRARCPSPCQCPCPVLPPGEVAGAAGSWLGPAPWLPGPGAACAARSAPPLHAGPAGAARDRAPGPPPEPRVCRFQVGKMQGNKGFNMEKQNHAPRKQHQQHPPPSIPANGQQANSQSESRFRRGGPPGPALGRRCATAPGQGNLALAAALGRATGLGKEQKERGFFPVKTVNL